MYEEQIEELRRPHADCDPAKYCGCFKNWFEWLESEVE